jgi:hypothetical protein
MYCAGSVPATCEAESASRAFVHPRISDIIGAPQPMKMGTTPSRFPYDAAARDAL